MSNEVELKLAVTSDAFDTLKTHLNQFNILEQNTVFLGNTYFDYPDHFLAKQKMGLRVRRENNDFTLTLKTDGKWLVDCIAVQNIIYLYLMIQYLHRHN